MEKLLAATEPRQDTQAILDTALARGDAAAHLRFETFLSEAGRTTPPPLPAESRRAGRWPGSTNRGPTISTGPWWPSPGRTSPSPTA